MAKPTTQLIFWNALGSMLKKWHARKIPKGRAFNLLRLWVGYDFTDLMNSDGCFELQNFNNIRQRLTCNNWSIIIQDIINSRSFYMFANEEGTMVRFCSPIWHTPTVEDGQLMQGSYEGNDTVTECDSKVVSDCDSYNNENINKNPQKENKEKGVFRDEWAVGFAEHYPTLANMKEPLTEEQYLKVLEKGYSRDAVIAKLQRMENYRRINNYSSVYRTLLDWLK